MLLKIVLLKLMGASVRDIVAETEGHIVGDSVGETEAASLGDILVETEWAIAVTVRQYSEP